MAKKKIPSGQPGALQARAVSGVRPKPFAATPTPALFAGMGPTDSMSPALRDDVAGGRWVAGILSFMMLVVPAIGVPDELLLQDTLKSMVASFAVLGAALLFFWLQRRRVEALRWHVLMWLPLSLMFYALGSMAWSHAYLGGVEAIRWFIFSLLLWLGMNTLTRERLPGLAWGIHVGAMLASVWTALQFWIDFRYFPQGPNPASTFVNRNFFAEYVVCTLPFSVWLLAQSRNAKLIAFLALSLSLNVVALLMTGTRSALAAMWLLLFVVFPLLGFAYRRQLAFSSWDMPRRVAAAGIMLIAVIGLGLIPTDNPKIAAELRGENALERGILRSFSVLTDRDEFSTGSLSIRLTLWKATGRMIGDRPLSGVGAGAWEVYAPLYQTAGSQIETDYYAHNEILQLLAEYGLIGWGFVLCLAAYLASAAWATLKSSTAESIAQAPLRAMALSSLLALLIVSNAGFPWRLASTGLIFAICLSILAASDTRLSLRKRWTATELRWTSQRSHALVLSTSLLIVLATYISWQAVQCERKIVRAVQLALAISQSGDPNNPGWDRSKLEMMDLIQEGIAINPHYRKLTPMVADELAHWGDWKNAILVWESMVASRPYVVAILSNIGRGYAQLGDAGKVREYLVRARRIQPAAIPVRSLEVLFLSRTGRGELAARLVKQYLAEGSYDYDMVNTSWLLGLRSGDYDLAIRGLELRNEKWPARKVDGLLKLGNLYANQIKDDSKALASYQAALAAASPDMKVAVRQQIPPAFLARL